MADNFLLWENVRALERSISRFYTFVSNRPHHGSYELVVDSIIRPTIRLVSGFNGISALVFSHPSSQYAKSLSRLYPDINRIIYYNDFWHVKNGKPSFRRFGAFVSSQTRFCENKIMIHGIMEQ